MLNTLKHSRKNVTTYRFTRLPPSLRLQSFDDDGKLMQDPNMQILEVFCTCWFTFEVRLPPSDNLLI